MDLVWNRLVVRIAMCGVLIGCAPSPPAPVPAPPPRTATVRIAAAADLRLALPEILAQCEQQDATLHCEVTYGASGVLYSQLENQAPFDLFLSADVQYPQRLVDLRLAEGATQFEYAIGHVVVWVPRDAMLDLDELGLRAVLAPTVRKVVIANPRHAPYGRAAEAALKSAGLLGQIADRLVIAESISQAAQFLETGAADIGLISLSVCQSPALAERGRYWIVPQNAYPPLVQGGVILNAARERQGAERVKDYLRSDAGRAILRKFGFGEPGSAAPKQ